MKRAILLSSCCLFFIGCAGMQVVPESERQLQKVYDLPNMSKNIIFDKTLSWMAETFVSSKEVIELKDRKNGRIIGNGMTTFTNVSVSIPCKYTLIIDIKDNKIRLTYKKFIGMWDGQPIPVIRKLFIDRVIPKLENTSNDLFGYLKAKEKSEW